VDGVGLFLAKKGVGRAAIRRVYWFALFWGLINGGVCALATSLGSEVEGIHSFDHLLSMFVRSMTLE
jgi:hypothetical protein